MSSLYMDDKQSLLQPLIPDTATTFGRPSSPASSSFSSAGSTFSPAAATSASLPPHRNDHLDVNKNACDGARVVASNSVIIIRLVSIFLVAVISVWANYEASKIFEVTIVNDAKDSPAGRRFALFYASNDRATRIVLNTSSFVEHLLYPNKLHQPQKYIERVTLRLASRNFTPTVTITAAATGNYYSGEKGLNDYVIDISPSILEEVNYDHAIVYAVQRAMARVWLWDGGSRAPRGLIDGLVEYIAELAGFHHEKLSGTGAGLPECDDHDVWWEHKDPGHVAHYLHYCERYKKGFIQQLNEAMRDTWHNKMVDEVLGIAAKKLLCGSYNTSSMPVVI